MKIDFKKRVLVKLDEINVYLNELDSIIPDDEKQYSDDIKIKRACEKTIELAIENVVDIIAIIVANKKLGVPGDEESMIELVLKKKIISKDLAGRLKQMKGFRNILVHRYGEVDDSLVYNYLTEEIEDFDIFDKDVKKFLKSLS